MSTVELQTMLFLFFLPGYVRVGLLTSCHIYPPQADWREKHAGFQQEQARPALVVRYGMYVVVRRMSHGRLEPECMLTYHPNICRAKSLSGVQAP